MSEPVKINWFDLTMLIILVIILVAFVIGGVTWLQEKRAIQERGFDVCLEHNGLYLDNECIIDNQVKEFFIDDGELKIKGLGFVT